VLLVTAVTLTPATGCSSGGAAADARSVEKPNLTVAVVPAVDSAGFFIALYRGLFRAQGLNAKFVPAISSETVIANQVNGRYDITGGNYVSYIQAQQSHRANLDIFAEGSVLRQGAIGIYTMPGSPIKTLDELKGRARRSRTPTGQRSKPPLKPCPGRSACPRPPRRSCPWRAIRSARARSAAWTGSSCGA
jgi:NitT/TauT family transport system substrate-binding protein